MNDFAKTGWIRSAVDYAGLVAFAVVYLITRDILKATWAIVIGSVLGVVVGLLVLKKLAPMPLIAAASGIVFGGLSLIFKDSIFIKLKLTIVQRRPDRRSLDGQAAIEGLAWGRPASQRYDLAPVVASLWTVLCCTGGGQYSDCSDPDGGSVGGLPVPGSSHSGPGVFRDPVSPDDERSESL